MTVVVQNDTGTQAGANAYADETYYRAYFLLRGIDVTGQSTEDVEAGLINARDYMDYRFDYIGVKTGGDDQTTELPRTYENPNYRCGCRNYYGRGCCNYITVADLTSNLPTIDSGISTNIKDASCEYAYQWVTGGKDLNNTFTSEQQTIKRKKSKVDVIEKEVEYQTTEIGASTYPIYQRADSLMKKTNLIDSTTGSSHRA